MGLARAPSTRPNQADQMDKQKPTLLGTVVVVALNIVAFFFMMATMFAIIPFAISALWSSYSTELMFLGVPLGAWSIWAVVRWMNRRDDPRCARRPPDAP